MKALALSKDGTDARGIHALGPATVGTVDVQTCAVSLARPPFDPAEARNRRAVLVQVEAFSANFRDKALCLDLQDRMRAGLGGVVGFFGSEFCARVVAVGDEVGDLVAGDRVIADGTYPHRSVAGVPGGIVTNHASRGWLVLHESQVVRVPEAMSSVEAAAFSLGAQTAQSMIRRAGVVAGDRVLVMSGRSNTSMFLIQLLVDAGARVTVASTGAWTADQRTALPGGVELMDKARLDELVAEADAGSGGTGGGIVDVVMDPFFDLNIVAAVRLLDLGGRYVTCGLQAQHASFAEDRAGEGSLGEVMTLAILKNLSLLGNCIGQRHDLERALERYAAGAVDVQVDSVWDVEHGPGFVERTFSARDRFGKVVMRYATDT